MENEALTTVDTSVVFDETEYAEIRKEVKELRDLVEQNYWDLSVLIADVYNNNYYAAWGYASFAEYCDGELDFQLRKAQYLVNIQDWFGKLKPSVQTWAKGLGWSKTKELVGIVTNENAAEWKHKLVGKTLRETIEIVKVKKTGADLTEDDIEDLNADTAEKPKRLSFSLFDQQTDNVKTALAKAKEMGETDKDGHALDLIATEFLATNAGIDNIEEYLNKIEKVTGLRLVAYNPSEDTIVYGDALLEEMASE